MNQAHFNFKTWRAIEWKRELVEKKTKENIQTKKGASAVPALD